MINTPVCIIGAGPIGLAGALLLSEMGVKSLLVERRSEVNPHPRSRFVDTNTMELMRVIGIQKEVEATGLEKSWTEYNRWLTSVCGDEIAAIPSPTFLRAPRDTSPCVPAMSCQDYVEQELLKKAATDPNIDIRFKTEAFDLEQDDAGTALCLRYLTTGETEPVAAKYSIGTDGPRSTTRSVIGSVLEAEPRPINSQDVIFEADLSKWIDKRKGSLIYVAAVSGVVIFQPLDGKRRWRCQVVISTADLISEDEIRARIKDAIGTSEPIPIKILSMNVWQPTPGSVDKFWDGRVFIAGDAAHISVPTGGMGNNTGFAGIRNLTWKMALVIKGVLDPRILETYQAEHKPLALSRIAAGVDTTERMGKIFIEHYGGGDPKEAAKGVYLYADYDGLLMGYELASEYIAKDETPRPEVEDVVKDYKPSVVSGRRAPHIWVDAEGATSILDWVGTEYALVLGARVDELSWQEAVTKLRGLGLPITLRQLPSDLRSEVYADDDVILIRPDGIIVDHWKNDSVSIADRDNRLRCHIPLAMK